MLLTNLKLEINMPQIFKINSQTVFENKYIFIIIYIYIYYKYIYLTYVPSITWKSNGHKLCSPVCLSNCRLEETNFFTYELPKYFNDSELWNY